MSKKPRVRKASLQEQLETCRELLKESGNREDFLRLERAELAKHVNRIAGENESLRSDIQWLKQLVQHLVIPAAPRT